MKVAIQCESPLLQRSLELFLEGRLSSQRHCDIVIRDYEVLNDEHLSLVIGTSESSDLIKPFSKAQLFHALGKKLDLLKHEISANTTVSIQEEEETTVSFDILERHIEKLTTEYQSNILKAVRAFYEK
ncbi:MAG TPA: hypothetical protein PLM93_10580 [Sulfuricurvum sp.]|nr:MAG: hypothetical protein B7Y30_08740 [Campylobacterales bacterium 16-40-21]OZA02379.1 MAG: hypothetical protein B7X89_09490 [Sulfuricurvum sp. 17-40-25]HQS67615.1 hypothetical protein [Sulfuricurvum sp.]HQT37017.1 hypothetical protein [Sulfuricurvum sp.]